MKTTMNFQEFLDEHKRLNAEVSELRALATAVWVSSSIASPIATDYIVPKERLLALRNYVNDLASSSQEPK